MTPASRMAACNAASTVVTDRRGVGETEKGDRSPASRNCQPGWESGVSIVTEGKRERSSGVSGMPCAAMSLGLAQTTMRTDPTEVAIIELSGNRPIRTAMSIWSSTSCRFRSCSSRRISISGKRARKSVTTGSTCNWPNWIGAVTTSRPFGSVNSPAASRSASSTCSMIRRAAAR
ncbi:hypothetical protein D3C71_1641260 [compost metagenome]